MTATRTNKKQPHRPDSDRYLDLVRQFPLRPIRSKRGYAAATKMIEQLAVQGEDRLNTDECDYLDVLTNLIEVYDRQNCPELDDGSPLERLKFLLKESGLRSADLGRLLGNSGVASQILLGRRELSKNQIRILSRHFKLDAGYFL